MHPVYTVGHSTRSLGELIALLKQNGIELLADVRRYPASRRHPQFARDGLTISIPGAGIEYVWFEDLGGRRNPRKDSYNTAWHNAGFRGYADYMETEPFAAAVTELMRRAQEKRTAVMCAERAWQQCHRGLIADFMKSHGIEVIHILGPGRSEPHPGTAAMRIVDGKLSYRAPDAARQSDLDL